MPKRLQGAGCTPLVGLRPAQGRHSLGNKGGRLFGRLGHRNTRPERAIAAQSRLQSEYGRRPIPFGDLHSYPLRSSSHLAYLSTFDQTYRMSIASLTGSSVRLSTRSPTAFRSALAPRPATVSRLHLGTSFSGDNGLSSVSRSPLSLPSSSGMGGSRRVTTMAAKGMLSYRARELHARGRKNEADPSPTSGSQSPARLSWL